MRKPLFLKTCKCCGVYCHPDEVEDWGLCDECSELRFALDDRAIESYHSQDKKCAVCGNVLSSYYCLRFQDKYYAICGYDLIHIFGSEIEMKKKLR